MSGLTQYWRCWCSSLLVGGVLIASLQEHVFAQITPDNTLPNNSIVTPDGSSLNITGGTQAGSNLFHSFGEFSVPNGGTAFFNNATDIQNIISRVTGGSASNIDGLIRANGAANLFLINPSGIIFGQNSQLNIGGSFVGTTANALQFGNRGFFSATEKNIPSPLLTINPSALLFNQINQNATIQNSSVTFAGTDPAGFNAFGLRVGDGKSLLLMGGNVSIDGGKLNAYGGRVELGGLAAAGTVGLNMDGNNLSLSFPEGVERTDVSFTNAARLDVAAGDGGNIAIYGRNLNIAGGSELVGGIRPSLGSVDSQAGDITLNVTGAIKVDASSIFDSVYNASGNSGSIRINAESLFLSNGSYLESGTFGKGNGGSIFVQASGSVSLANSHIDSTVETGTVGAGGDINITSGSLSLTNAAQLLTFVRGTSDPPAGRGDAGNVNIDVRDAVTIDGVNNERVSAVYTYVDNGAIGNAGDINITAGSLSLTNSAKLDASIYGQGNAGSVFVQSSDSVSLVNSNILSAVGSEAKGSGGDINIKAKTLSLTDDGNLITSTLGRGSAGSVFVQASDSVSLINSAIASSVQNEAIGNNGGEINITTGALSLIDGAALFARTSGQGNASNIFVQASGRVSLANNSFIDSSVAKEVVGSNGGHINITAGSLSLTNGASLSASTSGQGNGGSIFVQASDSVSLTNSYMLNSVDSGAVGNGGHINIKAKTFSLTDGAALITSILGKGNAGSVFVQASGKVSLASDSRISSNVVGVGTGGDINITANSLSLTDGAALLTATPGQGNAGNVTIKADGAVSFDGARVINGFPTASGAYSGVIPVAIPGSVGIGNGGDINIIAGSFSLTNGAELSTFTGGQGNAGNVTIKADGTVLLDGVGKISGIPVASSVYSGVGALPAGKTFGFLGLIPDQGIVGNGKGGNINITAGTLSLTNGAQLQTSTAGQGNAGSVFVQAKNSVSLAGSDTGIFSNVFPEAVGKGGEIDITAGSLFLTSGAELAASTQGRGNAGNILVNATDSVELSGVASFPVLEDGRAGGFSSGLFTNTSKGASGQGGELGVTTGILRVSDGAVLSARSQSGSKGGNITVNANVLEVINGGQFLTTAFNSGDAGNIAVKVKDRITISGSDCTFSDRFNSVAKVFGEEQAKGTIDPVRPEAGLFANTAIGSSGNGGSIFIDPMRLAIADGGGIAVDSQGIGKGGNLQVQAGSLTLDNKAFLSAIANSSQGGDIALTVQDLLLLRRNSQISTTAGNREFGGNGGNITINSPFIVAVPKENSDISANAFTGIGGRVDITTNGIYGIFPQKRPTEKSDITASSEFGVSGEVTINSPDTDPSRGLIQLPSNLVDASQQIAQGCTPRRGQNASRFIATGRGGLPQSPNEPLRGRAVITSWVDLPAQATAITDKSSTASMTKSDDQIVEAQGWIVDGNGNIMLVAQSPQSLFIPSAMSCSQ